VTLAPAFKETSHRVDGVFLPKEAGLPVYFLEVQFYPLPNVYAGLLAKVYTYLKRHDPAQSFCGVVLFADRSLEPTELTPYQPLLDAGLSWLSRKEIHAMLQIHDIRESRA
jgi:predicted transposase YdaD